LKLNLYFLFFVSIFFASCVSNKRLVYFQDKTLSKPQDTNTNSVKDRSKSTYLIQAGDILYIQITSLTIGNPLNSTTIMNPDQTQSLGMGVNVNPFTKGYTVNDDGVVDLPVLGKVKVRGKTMSQVEGEVQKLAIEYFPESSAKVMLLDFYVTVLGEVTRPGTFNIFDNEITLTEALGLAGDLTYFGNRNNIKIVRTKEGKTEVFHVDITNEKFLGSEFYFLQPNDLVYVRPYKSKKFLQSNSLPLTLSAISTLILVLNFVQK